MIREAGALAREGVGKKQGKRIARIGHFCAIFRSFVRVWGGAYLPLTIAQRKEIRYTTHGYHRQNKGSDDRGRTTALRSGWVYQYDDERYR